MYEFKYGTLPINIDDAMYCQLKGCTGLYTVDEINHKENTVTISSIGANLIRDHEVKPLKNIRFISRERYQLFLELTKQTESIDNECKIGECITNISLPKTVGLRFAIHHALLSTGIGNMVLNEIYFVMLANVDNALHERVLVKMSVEDLQTYLNKNINSSQDEAEAHLHALSKGLVIGERYQFFDPLWSARPVVVEITTVNRDSIKYKVITATGSLGKVEKILYSGHVKMLTSISTTML